MELPGRKHASFAISCGGERESEAWSLKIAGRVAISVLCGCGMVKSLEDGNQDPEISEDAYLAYLKAKDETEVPMVRDYSEGSTSNSKTIDPAFEAQTSVGLWRKVKGEKGKTMWYK
jgi:hypothetical protein